MIIHGFTISAFGHCAGKQEHDSRKLARNAVGYLTSLLDSYGNEFQLNVPMKGVGEIELRMSSKHLSCGMASFSAGGELLSTNVMVSGVNLEADKEALRMGQVALTNVCAAAEEAPPADDIVNILERPSLATIRWTTRDRKMMDLLADIEICFAAAFLQRAFRGAEILDM